MLNNTVELICEKGEIMLELNKIHLGDSYELIKEIPDKSVDCIYTDVPYFFKNSRGKGGGVLGERFNKGQEELEFINDGFKKEILQDFIRISKTINIFLWCNKFQFKDVIDFIWENGFKFELLTWEKTNPFPMTSNVWLSDIEYCFWIAEYGLTLNDGYLLKSKSYSSPINQSDKGFYEHPSIKPLELVTRHLLHTTQPNDIVLDCFSGSGTTCVAAKELGRRFIGIEIDERYHKISVDRLNGICANGQTSIFSNFNLMNGG